MSCFLLKPMLKNIINKTGVFIMNTKFVRINFNNNPAAAAETEEHRKVIEEQAADGYAYAGYFPVKMGPSGKMLVADLIFQKVSE